MNRSKKSERRDEPKAAEAGDEVYVVVNPVTYGEPEVRREAGEEVTDLPAQSVPWLLEQGHIRSKGA